MKASTRIILNTAVSYARSLFGIFTALFSTRWILEALGATDFGLFGVVGSLITLAALLNNGLVAGITRFYAFSIGEGKNQTPEIAKENLMRWFNTAFSLQLLSPLAFIAIGWPVGEYAIQNWLTIPDDRLEVALHIFRLSLASTFIGFLTVPYASMYSAHQKITDLAVFGVLRSLLTLLLAWLLLRAPIDKLLFYAYGMVSISLGLSLIQSARAMVIFPACRLRWKYFWNKTYFKKLFGFAGWKMLGLGFFTLRGRGIPILINLEYGPIINATYSIAENLSKRTTSLSQSLNGAFRPALVTEEGKGERQAMLDMSLQACKFGSILVALFAIPLIIEIDNVLVIWLKEPPQYTAEICQWLLASLIVDRSTSGHVLAINAKGRIASFQTLQGVTQLLVLPLILVLIPLGIGISSVGIAIFSCSILCCLIRVIFAKFLVNLNIENWMLKILAPTSLIILITAMCGVWVSEGIDAPILGVLSTSVTCILVMSILSWFLLFTTQEKRYLFSLKAKLAQKFKKAS